MTALMETLVITRVIPIQFTTNPLVTHLEEVRILCLHQRVMIETTWVVP